MIGFFDIGIFDLEDLPALGGSGLVVGSAGEQRIVGECLAAVRARAGVTQRDLAVRLGKPQSFVSAYENGQRRIDLLELLAIVDELKADPRAVFDQIVERREREVGTP